jgi:molybdopterin converting factor small subunit
MKGGDMKVQVNMYANLRQYSPANETSFTLKLACGSTVGKLINTLKIPQNIKMVILINGRRADADTPLSPEDKIILFPPMEGG